MYHDEANIISIISINVNKICNSKCTTYVHHILPYHICISYHHRPILTLYIIYFLFIFIFISYHFSLLPGIYIIIIIMYIPHQSNPIQSNPFFARVLSHISSRIYLICWFFHILYFLARVLSLKLCYANLLFSLQNLYLFCKFLARVLIHYYFPDFSGLISNLFCVHVLIIPEYIFSFCFFFSLKFNIFYILFIFFFSTIFIYCRFFYFVYLFCVCLLSLYVNCVNALCELLLSPIFINFFRHSNFSRNIYLLVLFTI